MLKYIVSNYSLKELISSVCDEYLWSVLKHLPGFEGIALRKLYLRIFSASCGNKVVFERNVFVRCSSNLSIGDNVFINRDVHLAALGGITIGDNVAIGPRVVIITNDHKFSTLDTQYQKRAFVKRRVTIGNNTIIGSNCYLNPGVTIGNNCIISAGTAVNIDIPDNTTVSGQVVDLFSKNMKKSVRNFMD